MLHDAKAQTGLYDFGDKAFLEPFETLIRSLNSEARLNDAGHAALKGHYVNLLVNRLRFTQEIKTHPAILREELKPPIAVVGMPRSGTTKLHRVLASDPGLRPLLAWQLMNPARFPEAQTDGPDPRIAYAQQVYDAMAAHYPDVLAGHPMSAEDPDEETSYLMEMTFDGPLVPVRAYTPSFTKWRWSRSMIPSYQYLKTLFQYLQWQESGQDGQAGPFLLKSPLHLGHIEDFSAVFTAATIVHCHRDPMDSVPSFARLLEVGWSMMMDAPNLALCGRESMALLKQHMDRYLIQRARLEGQVTFIDTAFRDIVSDPVSLVEAVYKAHGLSPDKDLAARVADWERQNTVDRFGKHTYSLERYGLTEETIRAEFSDYYQRFADYL